MAAPQCRQISGPHQAVHALTSVANLWSMLQARHPLAQLPARISHHAKGLRVSNHSAFPPPSPTPVSAHTPWCSDSHLHRARHQVGGVAPHGGGYAELASKQRHAGGMIGGIWREHRACRVGGDEGGGAGEGACVKKLAKQGRLQQGGTAGEERGRHDEVYAGRKAIQAGGEGGRGMAPRYAGGW